MDVTASNGDAIFFNADHFFMITGPLASDKTAVFYLHVTGTAPIQVAGTMDAYVATLPANTFAELHFAVEGTAFYARGSLVTTLSAATAAQKAKHASANAMIALGGKERLITETVSVASTAINQAGGNL